MPKSQQPVAGRGGRGGERKTERLPPIYVTPTFEKQVLDSLGERDFAEFGREALEHYMASLAGPGTAEERGLTFELDAEQLAKLTALSESFGIKVVAHFVEHLAKRALSVEPRELHSFFYGDFFKNAEAAEIAERERLEGEKVTGKKGNGKAA